LLIAALLLACTAWVLRPAYGYDPDYAPFLPTKAPRPFKLGKCDETAPRTEGGIDRAYDMPGGRGRLQIIEDEGGWQLLVTDQQGKMLFGPKTVTDFTFGVWEGPYWADLNGDKKPDFVIDFHSGGCGLGGAISDRVVVLSVDDGYEVVSVTTYFADQNDFVRMADGKCAMLHQGFIYGDVGRDGREHNYWVFQMLRFKGSRLEAVTRYLGLPELPAWIMYTHKPNHQPTTQLTAEQKRALLAGQGELPCVSADKGKPPQAGAPQR
jgi:hypothetical protein